MINLIRQIVIKGNGFSTEKIRALSLHTPYKRESKK